MSRRAVRRPCCDALRRPRDAVTGLRAPRLRRAVARRRGGGARDRGRGRAARRAGASWCATARAACTGSSRWSRWRRRPGGSPTGRSPRATCPGLFDAGFLEGGAHGLALGPAEEIPYLARQERLDVRARRRHRSGEPRGLRGARRLRGLRRALELAPADIVEAVIESGLRGRGGAAFPTGIKWKTVLGTAGRSEVRRLQRRRRRLRHVLRSHDDGRRSASC